MFRVIHETETVVAIVEWQEGLLHSKTSLVPNVGTLVPLDSQMLPCWRQQSAWAVTGVFCLCSSNGEHERRYLQKFRIILSFSELPSRDRLRKVRRRNLPSGWSTEASDSPFQSCYSHHFWSLQTGTAMKIRGEKTSQGWKLYAFRRTETNWTSHAIVHKVKQNREHADLDRCGA